MRVFDMIRLLVPELEPKSTKVHLANHNGLDDPLEVFLAGRFPEWQSYQAQKNFERQFVLSLMKLEERDRWLYAGVFKVDGPCIRVPDLDPRKADQDCWRYPMSELTAASELTGRLVVHVQRPGRQPYLYA